MSVGQSQHYTISPRNERARLFGADCTVFIDRRLLQLGVLGFELFHDGGARVGVFPEGDEILIGGTCPDAGGTGIRSRRSSRLQSIGTSDAQMRQRASPAIPDDAAVVKNFLKLRGSSDALASREICLPTDVRRIKARSIVAEWDVGELDRQ